MEKDTKDIFLFRKLRSKFKKENTIIKGQLGIYHYIWSCETNLENSQTFKYDVFVKIKAIEVYDNVIEVEILDMQINDSANEDVINIIKNNIPTYVNPKYVSWQIID